MPISLTSAQKPRLWVLVRTCTHNLCFEQKQEKYQHYSSKNVHFLQLRNLCILHEQVFVMKETGSQMTIQNTDTALENTMKTFPRQQIQFNDKNTEKHDAQSRKAIQIF